MSAKPAVAAANVIEVERVLGETHHPALDRKSTRLNSSH